MAVAEINRHTASLVGTAQSADQLHEPARLFEVSTMEDTNPEQSTWRCTVPSRNSFNGQLALSGPDQRSSLHTRVNNAPQSVVKGTNERVEACVTLDFGNSLHFGEADALGDRTRLYEPLESTGVDVSIADSLHFWESAALGDLTRLYEPLNFTGVDVGIADSLHFWESDALRGYPLLYEPLDFSLSLCLQAGGVESEEILDAE